MRLAVLADNQGALYDSYSTVDSFDSGAAALATALPRMPSLTTLDLSSTAKLSARCGFLVLGLLHRWLGGSSHCLLWRAGARSDVGGGLEGWRGSEGCAARRQPDRRLRHDCAGGGAAADAEPHDARSHMCSHACTLRIPLRFGFLVGAFASVVRLQLALSSLACGRTVGCGRRAVGLEGQ